MDINKELGNNTTDPYERQLLEMFKSCDSQENGFLNKSGLEKLCDKLHLDDAKDQLIECLLVGKTTVTFPEFRDALLTLLGSGLRQSEESRDPSPEREVSPKFVFGQKKYGRRSRPESTDQEGGGQDIRVDDSDIDAFLPSDEEISVNLDQKNDEKSQNEDQIYINKDEIESQCSSRNQLQGDEELRVAWERLGVGSDGYLDQDELALVCRAVGMERAANEIVNEVFSKLDCDRDGRISFNEFLQLFRGGVATTPPSPQRNNPLPSSSSPPPFHPHHLTSLDVSSSGYVSADSIVELWELSGVPGANTLLQEIGLSGAHEVSLSLLSGILDEELRNLRTDIAKLSVSPLVTYLSAALSLSHVQIKQLRTSVEQMTGERDKLRNDLAEANHRATLLAQEVDDRHARMERSTQIQVKLLEQRHAEQVKQLGLQIVSEREQLTATTLRLEKKLADVQEEEIRLRSELAALQSECANMEKENRSLVEQLSDYDMAQKRAEEQEQKMEALQLRLSELESNSDQVASLVEQLAELKEENTKLRDRNDELTIQVESLSTRLSNRKQGSCVSLEGGGGGTKRRGHSPPGTLLDSGSWCSVSPSPRQGKVRRCCTENDLSLDNVRMEGLAICQPLRHSESGLGADLDTLDDSLTLSNCSDNTISFKVGSDASKDADVGKLQAHIIELERMVEQYRLKLAVYEFGPEASDEDSDIVLNYTPEIQTVLNNRQIITNKETCDKKLIDKETSCETTDFKFGQREPMMEMEIQTSIEDPREVDKLEKHCQELQSKLSEVQIKILEIINDKKSCDEENSTLKEKIKMLTNSFHNKSPINFNDNISWESSHSVQQTEKTIMNKERNEIKNNYNCSIPVVEVSTVTKSSDEQSSCNSTVSGPSTNNYLLFKQTDCNNTKDDDMKDNKLNFSSLSQFAFEITNNLNDSDLDHKDLSVLETKSLSPLCLRSDEQSDMVGACNDNDDDVKEENDQTSKGDQNLYSLMNENKDLKEKCNNLESCLEMMRVEYEKCEDYWQNKLDEERRIYDQEQKLSDSKFIELERQIREYAEMFGGDSEKTCDGRLPTIEEKDSLERQFIDLEEEFEEFRRKAEAEALTREKEIMELKESLTNSQLHFSGCDAAIQTNSLSGDQVDYGKQKRSVRYEWQDDSQQIELENDNIEEGPHCCCSCHQGLSDELNRVQQLRSRMQSECKLLTRKRDLLLKNISNLQPRYPAACEREIMQNLAARLHHQELRCRHLQSALKYQQRQMEKAIQVSWEQHQKDLVNLRATLNLTQEKLQQQLRVTKELMDRLTKADVLVKDLYVENGQLVAACQNLEQRYTSDKATVSSLA